MANMVGMGHTHEFQGPEKDLVNDLKSFGSRFWARVSLMS